MISLEELDELIFGKDGFQNDVTSPLEARYWKVKINSLVPFHKYFDDNSSFCDNPIFNSINYTSEIAILSLLYEDTYAVLHAGRYEYFSLRIKDVLEKLLSNTSKSIRNNLIDSTESVRKKLRWYLFELNNICKKYAEGFELLLKAKNVNKSAHLVNATNYLITYYFSNILVRLYTQLLYIDNPSNVDIHNDLLLKEILSNEDDYIQTYKHIGDQIENLLSESSPDLLIIYPVIKRHFLDFSQQRLFLLRKYEKQSVILVENFIFINFGLYKILSDISILDSNLKTSLSFEEIYSMVENEISNFLLPNDRLNYIHITIKSIHDSLDDNLGEDYPLLQDSIPRRLIRALEFEFETIKANPLIDLKDFDRNKIRPLKVNLTVAQLALMFRLFLENNLVDVKEKTELYNTISKAFTSKASDTISHGSLKNKFNEPDIKDYEFWKHKFLELSRKSFKN